MKYIILIAILLTGCVETTSTACPAVRAWTPEDQIKLGQALTKIPNSSPIAKMAIEWSALRAEATACSGDR